METLTAEAALAEARRLVLAWGRAYYEAAYAGDDMNEVTVDGERFGFAAGRYWDLVASARCVVAARSLERAANGLLEAQAVLGRAEAALDVESRSVPSARWKALGRAEVRVEFAERAVRAATGLRLLPVVSG